MTITWTSNIKFKHRLQAQLKVEKVISHWLFCGSERRAYGHVTTTIFSDEPMVGRCARVRALLQLSVIRWSEPICMRVGYVFESRFSAGKI